MVGDVLNNVFGTKLKWGSDAADISSMRAGAGAMTSENARDIVNQGDTRMSDRDLVAAESMESMGVLDSSQEGVSAIKTIAGLKWRRLLLNMVTNPPGLEWGDIGQFGGETGPVVAGGGLGAAFGGIPGAVIGAGLASGAREGGQMLAGTQRESGKDMALRAGIEMGMETIPGLKQGYRALRDTIGKRTGREMAKVMENIKPDDLRLSSTSCGSVGPSISPT